jgi:acetyl esterase/lipase
MGMGTGRWLAVVALLLGGRVACGADARPAEAPAPRAVYEVVRHRDIPYRTDTDADPERHKLDLYLPKGKKDFPVLLFVHGGGWKSGNKSWYSTLGHAFAQEGIGVVVPNYRLSPQVRHPAHVEDVAKAFAWTRANIGKYGGRADRVFVSGHSAGGHLVALLAADPKYLKAEGLSPADVRGVIGISGVYEIYADFLLFAPVFGRDKDVCRLASPLAHVGGALPPFLLAYADHDYPQLDKQAEDMDAELKKCRMPSTILKVTDRNHFTIIINIIDPFDPLHRAIREMVTK